MLGDDDTTVSAGLLAELVGMEMSSVTFVRDYVQLTFDGPCLTALTMPVVNHPHGRFYHGNSGYRDALCNQIGHGIKAVEITSDRLALVFENEAHVVISLLDEDYVGPEAFNYTSLDGRFVVA